MWGSGKLFWDSWNLNFSRDYDRAKCQERVGENGLMVWILRAKWGKTHFWKTDFWTWCCQNRAAIVAAVSRFSWQNVQWFLDIKSCRGFQNRDTIIMNHSLRNSLFFSTLFCFELPFGVNMKVLDNLVSFSMALVWLEMFCGFWVMMKTLQVGFGEILRKFSITISKLTQTYGLFPNFNAWVLGV